MSLESLLLGPDKQRIRSYIEALIGELELDSALSVSPHTIEIDAYADNTSCDSWAILFAIHTASSDVRHRAMRRVLGQLPHRSLDELR